MNRRSFITEVSASLVASALFHSDAAPDEIDLTKTVVVISPDATPREKKAATVLVEEVKKRSQLSWEISSKGAGQGSHTIYLCTRDSAKRLGPNVAAAANGVSGLSADGFAIRAGNSSIAIVGSTERALFFGVGELLRASSFKRLAASVPTRRANIATAPKYSLRGHQLGYRPKTNAYDAWNVATWEQYIRDLAMFGTNAIELMPPRSDDAPDSPHFPLPPEQMMIEMSMICDSYGLDVWVWYPAMDPDYADAATVESALKEWAHIFEVLPRIDAIFVPGGDPGHTEPKAMLAFLEKQKASLRKFHPKAQMWMSPQGFREAWMNDFFSLISQSNTTSWLDGIVYGPQSRISAAELRKRVPKQYPIRFYPDITHSVSCQYPVPEWDIAFALTEGRECINPRPQDQANILRKYSPDTIGFLTYSEGCNDDVNKFLWSLLGWNPEMHTMDALREFSRYFFGHQFAEGTAQGLQSLEDNWRGPLASNDSVNVTLAKFQDIERSATPALLGNWRFQQALYRAYFDAALRARLASENDALARAYEILGRVDEIGWEPQPMDISQPASGGPPNGLDIVALLDEADRVLQSALFHPAGAALRARTRELGEALFQSIQMQLAVTRYQGEAVNRAANLETLETPVTNIAWLRSQIASVRKLTSYKEQITAVRQVLHRTDPGPGGFYDELGNPSNRPHLDLGLGREADPEFRQSALTGFSYPDYLGHTAPMAWKHWAESLFDEPLTMQYNELDPEAEYRIRVVYGGDGRRIRIRLVANEQHEIHPLTMRPWPPAPLEFDIPKQATANGKLKLAWTREQGLGGNGRGCQVCEVWLMRK